MCKKQNKKTIASGGCIKKCHPEKRGQILIQKKRRAHPTFIASNFLGALQAIHILRYAKIYDLNIPRVLIRYVSMPPPDILHHILKFRNIWYDFFLNGFQHWP